MYYSFNQKLAVSKSESAKEQMKTAVRTFWPHANSLQLVHDTNMDKAGCDYLVGFPSGNQLKIDHKLREPGCSKFWRNNEPDLAPELWSKIPEGTRTGIIGWTLDTTKATDWVICTFDPSDTRKCYLINYQEYQQLFYKHKDYLVTNFKTAEQDSGKWRSQCVFVPVSVFRNLGLEIHETEI